MAAHQPPRLDGRLPISRMGSIPIVRAKIEKIVKRKYNRTKSSKKFYVIIRNKRKGAMIMTKAFLEPTILKPENEKFIIDAFSKKSFEKMKEFDKNKRIRLKKTTKRKLSLTELFA